MAWERADEVRDTNKPEVRRIRNIFGQNVMAQDMYTEKGGSPCPEASAGTHGGPIDIRALDVAAGSSLC
jgi:hypothetical protein